MTIKTNAVDAGDKSSPGDPPFSVDLENEAKKHKVFLLQLHKLGVMTDYLDRASLEESVRQYYQKTQTQESNKPRFRGNETAFVSESIRRYAGLWLPLVARSKKLQIDLIPPPDVAWLWHCHRLAPYRYSEHMRKEFTTEKPKTRKKKKTKEMGEFESFEPSHPFVFQLDTYVNKEINESNQSWSSDPDFYRAAAELTRDLFAEMYPGESFFVDPSYPANFTGETTTEQHLLSGYDILAACQRQATFLWQVSGPSFSSETFLRDGIDNYLRFVKLTRFVKRTNDQKRSMWLVPTYQIDWIWHTHILISIKDYHNDVRRITGGEILDHDDSINDRTEGGTLDKSFRQTSDLWKEVYALDYFIEGGMYNGEPPPEYYRNDYFVQDDVIPGAANDAVVESTDLNDAAEFIPHANDWYCSYKENYVFGVGDNGMGYYRIGTAEANNVLIDRCERMKKRVLFFLLLGFVSFLVIHAFGILVVTSNQSTKRFWIGYSVAGMAIPIVFFPYNFWKYKRLGQTKKVAESRQLRIEEGEFNLFGRDKKSLVGAAACGYHKVYVRRNGGAPCGGGCGGGACGGGGCGGGGCGGCGGCGGGGCGG